MQQSNLSVGTRAASSKTNYILVIDDNAQMRSVLARHIMLSCSSRGRSCAIFRIGERAEPTLTYFNNPDKTRENQRIVVEFAIYEAASPRHALTWIRQTEIKHITIISDVIMPFDTEVGLPGLLQGLQKMEIAVNLLFISSEAQSREKVSPLLAGHKAYFLVKGSDVWTRLPDAIVTGSNRFTYKQLPKINYNGFGPASARPDSAAHLLPQPVSLPIPASIQKRPGLFARLFGRKG